MAQRTFAKGTVVEYEGNALTELLIIADGSVKASFSTGEILLKKGDVIGLMDSDSLTHSFTYRAAEPLSVISFSVNNKNSVRDLISSNPDIARFLYTSMINQTLAILMRYACIKADCEDLHDIALDYYEKYVEVCAKNNISPRTLPQFDDFQPLKLENDIPDWILGYYASHREFSDDLKSALPGYPALIYGLLSRSCKDVAQTVSLCKEMTLYYEDKMSVFLQDNSVDLFDLFTGLLFRLDPSSKYFEKVSATIEELISFIKDHPNANEALVHERVSSYLTKRQGINAAIPSTGPENIPAPAPDAAVPRELLDSLDLILEYSGVGSEMANYFRKCIARFKKLPDKASTDDDARALRAEITKCFYEIYTAAFLNSVGDMKLPLVMKMFFNFGFVDAELAGTENTNYLYSIVNSYNGSETLGVYTAYEWLYAVYSMKKDPSRNEFDTDYLAYIHEKKVQGKINQDEENQLAKDAEKRLRYELENMFPMVNKLTYGRLTIFCPVFCEFNVIKPLPACLVTPDLVISAYHKITQVDYSAYHRETIYTNEKAGIMHEYVYAKIFPNVILMPNVGTRPVMWQEIEGRKRTTPARFMISAFYPEDLQTAFTRLTGEYRWEMCKRVQGARWNDVTDKSLTSEYFDYIQFYRKNNELSEDAKEKIKQGLVKAKNSFKEMFVRDYMIWVIYEGVGAPRLNKIVRSIMCTYCPFPYELRQKMAANPLYKELLDHYTVKLAQKLHHLDNVMQKMTNAGVEVPDELKEARRFLEGK